MKTTKLLLTLILLSAFQFFCFGQDELPKNEPDTVSLIFIGDVMQHSRQIKAAYIGGDTLSSSSYNYSTYFKYIQKYIDKADYTVANMEFTLDNLPYSGYPCFSCPSSLVKEGQKSGIDLFLCANNHLGDRGSRGIKNTIETLEELGAEFTGLYRNSDEEIEKSPFIVNIKGMKIAFINLTYVSNVPIPAPYVMDGFEIEAIKSKVTRAKAQGAELIIALPHWGVEYSLQPSQWQIKWRDILFENGINYIIGAHPHVLQPVEVGYKPNEDIESIVAYSLGNYISNQYMKNCQLGMLFQLNLTRNQDNSIKVGYDYEYLWCARMGDIEKNFTTIPLVDFLDKKEAFLKGYEYEKMKATYERVRGIINLP